MNLIWSKLELDKTKDLLLKVQNRSLIPDSEVFYQISESSPTDETGAHVLVSKQVGRVTLVKGETLWYAGNNGGIFVSSSVEITKLNNYNITSVQETVTLVNDNVSVNVPEGATITFQNLSDTDAGFRIADGSTGNFILSEKQLFSESFASNGVVIFIPPANKKPSEIVYSITPSAVITQLSNSMKTRLDEMSASTDILIENSVTHDELSSFVASTRHNKWSSTAFKQGSNADSIQSPTFIGNVSESFSEPITDLDSFSMLMDLNLTYEDNNGTKRENRGVISLEGSYRQTGVHNALFSTCNDIDTAKLVNSVTLHVPNNRNELTVTVNLNQVVITSSLTTMIKMEHGLYEVKETPALPVFYISTFNVDLVNTGINLSDDLFTKNLVNSISIPNPLQEEYEMTVSSLVTGNSIFEGKTAKDTVIDSDKFSFVLKEVEDKFYLVYSFSTTEYPTMATNPRSISFNRINVLEDIFLNLRYLKGSVTNSTIGNIKTVVCELMPISRSHDYIKSTVEILKSKHPVNITMQTSKEV